MLCKEGVQMKEMLGGNLAKYYLDQYNFTKIFDENVGQRCRLFEYVKGDYLVESGTYLTYLLFLVKGEAKVYTSLDNGKSYLLRIESPLSIYGDVEILHNKICTANVEALKTCHVIGIPVRDIKQIYENQTSFLRYIIDSLSSRLVKISYMSTDNILLPLRNKIASYILVHLEEGTSKMTIMASLTDVAEQLGTTYRHLSRTLKEMVEEGIIIRQRREVQIVDIKKLKEMAGNTYKY